MVKVLKIAIYFLFCLGFAFSALAATPLDVVINEIAWMGTKTSYSDEWIELYNTTNQTINLDGWILKAEDGTPGIILAGSLPAKGFFILERTDEDTLPEILADQIYSGALENNGEDLKLLDNFGNLIDSVDCSDGWFEGDNETKQTMERKDSKLSGSYPDNWQTSQNLGGTPKAENSEQKTMNNKQETVLGRESPSGTVPQSSPKNLEESGSPPTYLSGIFINEILPSPEGPDAEEEWTVPTIQHFLYS